jgi:hypothetical protein
MKSLAATLGLLLGVVVAAPAHADTVTCTDGTTSESGRGACSHHGGVAKKADEKKADRTAKDDTATPARTRTRAEHKPAPVTRHEEPIEHDPERDNDAVPTASTHAPLHPEAAGAPTARCKDGYLSYSKHRSGTCADHGGVGEWLAK